MHYSYEFKKKYAKMYKQGKYHDTPSGDERNKRYLQREQTKMMYKGGYVKRCCNQGDIERKEDVGGNTGYIDYLGSISECENRGAVKKL